MSEREEEERERGMRNEKKKVKSNEKVKAGCSEINEPCFLGYNKTALHVSCPLQLLPQ